MRPWRRRRHRRRAGLHLLIASLRPEEGVDADGRDEHDTDDDILGRRVDASRSMPERSDCMTTAPSTAPGIVPMPPENEVPPMTAAEMTSSSACVPRFVTAALSRAVWTAALSAVSMPMSTKVTHERPADVDAAELGRVGVAADREDVAAESPAGRQVGHDQHDAEDDQHRVRDADRDQEAARRLGDVVVDRVLVGQRLRPVVVVQHPDADDDGPAAERADDQSRPLRTRLEAVLQAPAPPAHDRVDDAHAHDRTEDPARRRRRSTRSPARRPASGSSCPSERGSAPARSGRSGRARPAGRRA